MINFEKMWSTILLSTAPLRQAHARGLDEG
jgi:hypothetical protein